ncbi:unnamed protein product [Brassica rapa subsp. narinosa]
MSCPFMHENWSYVCKFKSCFLNSSVSKFDCLLK